MSSSLSKHMEGTRKCVMLVTGGNQGYVMRRNLLLLVRRRPVHELVVVLTTAPLATLRRRRPLDDKESGRRLRASWERAEACTWF